MPRLILGHTTDSSAKIWVRASERWPYAFIDVLDSADRKTRDTKVVLTDEGEFYTAVVEWPGLSAGQQYRVKVAFGKNAKSKPDERVRDAYTEGRLQTFPSPKTRSGFTFMLGSCNLHSLGEFQKPDKAWTQVSAVSKQNEAAFMIHAGDQIYADIPLPPRSNYDFYRRKYLDAWDDCVPARKVLTELPHYMILDDHEITNDFDNDMKTGFLRGDPQNLVRIAMKVYWEFQHSHNPQSPRSGYHYHYDFNFGSTRFFVMDTRYHRRSQSGGTGQMIAPEQEQDLLDWFDRYPKSLKFIVTSVPFLTEVARPGDDKWCSPCFQQQRSRILAHIVSKKIEKVVFLTGDMHSALHSTMKISDGKGQACTIHELMSSPINQITPEHPLDRDFIPSVKPQLAFGLKATCKIDPGSYYGKHSNLMAIEVTDSGDIKYRIYRTTKSRSRPEKNRSFTLT